MRAIREGERVYNTGVVAACASLAKSRPTGAQYDDIWRREIGAAMPMRAAPSLFPPIDPLLNTRVDPPTYGWPQLSTLALYNKTRELRRLLKRESPNSIGLDGRTPLQTNRKEIIFTFAFQTVA